MAKKKTTQADEPCGCLKCAVRNIVLGYYHEKHGDKPGMVVMDTGEAVNALGYMMAEIISSIPDAQERMNAVAQISGGILFTAEHLRKNGQAPASTEIASGGTTVH